MSKQYVYCSLQYQVVQAFQSEVQHLEHVQKQELRNRAALGDEGKPQMLITNRTERKSGPSPAQMKSCFPFLLGQLVAL